MGLTDPGPGACGVTLHHRPDWHVLYLCRYYTELGNCEVDVLVHGDLDDSLHGDSG